jgi:hypothetical protein
VALHITTGTVGLISFWVPVVGRKGGANHARYGKLFTMMMLATGPSPWALRSPRCPIPWAPIPHLVDHPSSATRR